MQVGMRALERCTLLHGVRSKCKPVPCVQCITGICWAAWELLGAQDGRGAEPQQEQREGRGVELAAAAAAPGSLPRAQQGPRQQGSTRALTQPKSPRLRTAKRQRTSRQDGAAQVRASSVSRFYPAQHAAHPLSPACWQPT
jgi:hypothetical protein